jgi:hypothetical protein
MFLAMFVCTVGVSISSECMLEGNSKNSIDNINMFVGACIGIILCVGGCTC